MSRVLFVASAGGHLAELHRLHPRLVERGDELAWISTEHPHSRSLLEGLETLFVPDAPSRDWRAAWRNAQLVTPFLRRFAPHRVVSNGASIAVSTMLQPVARRVRCDYIENSVRVRGPSMTGRILGGVPWVHTYTQYESWATRRWHVAGSLLDEWCAVAPAPPRPLRRVVVTVGTEAWPFRSLFERLAPLLRGATEVLWLSGSTDVTDLGIEGARAVPLAQLHDAIDAADLVVAHAGIGSAIAALDRGHAPLLVPRRAHRGEAVDDHQLDIGRELARRGLCELADAHELDHATLTRAASRRVQRAPRLPAFNFA